MGSVCTVDVAHSQQESQFPVNLPSESIIQLSLPSESIISSKLIQVKILSNLNAVTVEKIIRVDNFTMISQLKDIIHAEITDELTPNLMNLYYKGVRRQNHQSLINFKEAFGSLITFEVKKILLFQISSLTVAIDPNPELCLAVMPCKHHCGTDQMVRHIRKLIQEHKYQVKCPICKQLWNFEICMKVGVLTKQQFTQFKKGLEENQEKYLYQKCSNCQCEQFIGEIKNNAMKCKDCQKQFKIAPISDIRFNVERIFRPPPMQIQKLSSNTPNLLSDFLKLDLKFFEPSKNVTYWKNKIVERKGGFPFYLPPVGRKYGLNVDGKYDNGNNDWLESTQQQWAVGYHGLADPTPNLLVDLITTLATKHPTLPIIHCQYNWHPAVNKKPENVGFGIQFSPHIQECLRNFCNNSLEIDNIKYKVVLQCKIHPRHIRICENNEIYWVVQKAEFIRPFGIILISESQCNNYPKMMDSEFFSWSNYNTEINSYLKNMK